MAVKLPSFKGMPKVDRMTGFTVAAWVIAPLLLAWMFFGTRSRNAELEAAIETAVEDSTRYAQVIAANSSLTARRDSISQKLKIIQDIDAARFIWPHLLDEISRALPEYTWLTAIAQTEGGARPSFQITGQTGNNMALTRFMTELEASPFVNGVRLASTNLLPNSQTNQLVYEFILEASFEEPPADAIETVPLFGSEGE